MKTNIIRLLPFVLLFAAACQDVNYMHEEYLKRGEGIYTGVIDSLKAYPGNNRVKFTWQLNSDPRITKTVIYWNELQDSSVVTVNRTTSGLLQMETTMAIAEASYVFKIATKDDEGHQSIYVEQTVEVLGAKYASKLRNRNIETVKLTGEQATLTWKKLENTALLYTTVKYKDYTQPSKPEVKELQVANDVSKTILEHVKSGDTIEVVSTYRPTNSIDDFTASVTTYELK